MYVYTSTCDKVCIDTKFTYMYTYMYIHIYIRDFKNE